MRRGSSAPSHRAQIQPHPQTPVVYFCLSLAGVDPSGGPDGHGDVPAERVLCVGGGVRLRGERPARRAGGVHRSRPAALRGHHPGAAQPDRSGTGAPGPRRDEGSVGGRAPGLGEDPRPAQRSYTSRWPYVRRLLAVAVHFRIPLQIAQALLNPAAARRRRAPTVGLGSCDTSPAWRGPRTWSGCGNMCSARIARASR